MSIAGKGKNMGSQVFYMFCPEASSPGGPLGSGVTGFLTPTQ